MTPAAQHRAAAAICDRFTGAHPYITTSYDGLHIQIPADHGEIEDRIALWSLVISLVGATTVPSDTDQLEARDGVYNGVPVVSVYAPGVLNVSTDDVAAARAVNTANDHLNRQPFGSVA